MNLISFISVSAAKMIVYLYTHTEAWLLGSMSDRVAWLSHRFFRHQAVKHISLYNCVWHSAGVCQAFLILVEKIFFVTLYERFQFVRLSVFLCVYIHSYMNRFIYYPIAFFFVFFSFICLFTKPGATNQSNKSPNY